MLKQVIFHEDYFKAPFTIISEKKKNTGKRREKKGKDSPANAYFTPGMKAGEVAEGGRKKIMLSIQLHGLCMRFENEEKLFSFCER